MFARVTTLNLIYYLLLAAAFVVVLLRRNALPKRLWVFIAGLGAALVVQLADDALANKWPFIFHMYHVVEYGVLCYYLYLTLRQKILRRLFLYSIPLFAAFVGIYFGIWGEQWNTHSMPEFVVMALVVSTGTIFFFIELYTAKEIYVLRKLPDFWIGVANLIYYSGSILVLGMIQYMLDTNKSLAGKMIYISYFLNIFLYSFYLIGFLCRNRNLRF